MVPEKKKKKRRQKQEIRIFRITVQGNKRKNIIRQKERKGQPRQTPWKKSRDMQLVGQKKTKTFCERCNATITRVFNTSGANYKINLNRESEICINKEMLPKYIYIYVCVYVYFGSISLLIQISLNIIDILCLHIFFWIRSNSGITFIVFGGGELIYVLSIVVCIPSTFCPTLGHHQGRIYYKSDVTFVFAYYHYVRASLPLKIMAFAFKLVSIISVSS